MWFYAGFSLALSAARMSVNASVYHKREAASSQPPTQFRVPRRTSHAQIASERHRHSGGGVAGGAPRRAAGGSPSTVLSAAEHDVGLAARGPHPLARGEDTR